MQELSIIVGMPGFSLMEMQEEFWLEWFLIWASNQIIILVAREPNQPIVVNQKAIVRASRW